MLNFQGVNKLTCTGVSFFLKATFFSVSRWCSRLAKYFRTMGEMVFDGAWSGPSKFQFRLAFWKGPTQKPHQIIIQKRCCSFFHLKVERFLDILRNRSSPQDVIFFTIYPPKKILPEIYLSLKQLVHSQTFPAQKNPNHPSPKNVFFLNNPQKHPPFFCHPLSPGPKIDLATKNCQRR